MKNPLKAGVRLIEWMLRKSEGVYEFTDDPECIVRIQLTQMPHDITIGNVKISKGDPVLGIHAWNDRMPKLPKAGEALDWALRFRRQAIYSFELVAKEMKNDSKYSEVRALGGDSTLFSFSNHTGGLRMMQRMGFTVIPYPRPHGRFEEFWANMFSWWLMWAYNDASLNSREFRHLERTEVWITAEEFIRRFGG